MKLFTTITSERGKPVTKSGNEQIEIDLNIERKTFGRVIMTYEEYSGEYLIYFYPITEVTGKGGRTLLYKEVIIKDIPCQKCGGKRDVEALICSNCRPDDSGKNGVCVACKGKNSEGCTYC